MRALVILSQTPSRSAMVIEPMVALDDKHTLDVADADLPVRGRQLVLDEADEVGAVGLLGCVLRRRGEREDDGEEGEEGQHPQANS